MFPSKTLFLTRATSLHETMQILLKKAEPSVYTSPTHHRQVNYKARGFYRANGAKTCTVRLFTRFRVGGTVPVKNFTDL